MWYDRLYIMISGISRQVFFFFSSNVSFQSFGSGGSHPVNLPVLVRCPPEVTASNLQPSGQVTPSSMDQLLQPKASLFLKARLSERHKCCVYSQAFLSYSVHGRPGVRHWALFDTNPLRPVEAFEWG
jgi:hypothetical protein